MTWHVGKEKKPKPGRLSEPTSKQKKETAILVPLEILQELTLKRDTAGPWGMWEVTTVFRGTRGKYTYSVAVAMVPDKENNQHIKYASLEIMVNRPSKTSKHDDGKLIQSNHGKKS
jgi:hypothetical protein